jgi:outer membrane protein TolC
MKKTLVSILFSIIGNICFSQSTIQLSLEEAIQYTIKNKPAVKIAALDATIASEKLQESKRRYITDVTSDFTIQYNPTIQTSIIPIGQFNVQNPTSETRAVQFGQPWSNSAGVKAKQILFDAALRGEIKERKLELSIAQLAILTQQEKLFYNVTKAYYALLLAREELTFAVSDTLRAYQLYQVATNRFIQNQIKSIDQKQAEFNLQSARYNWLKSKANEENAIYTFVFQTGLPADQKIQLKENFTDNAGLTTPSTIDSSMFNNRSDYKRSVLENQLYTQQAYSERSKLLPVVSLNGFLGANQFTKSFNLSESNSWFGNSYVNLNVQLPLTSFFTRTRKVQQYVQRAKQSTLELEQINQQNNYNWRTSLNNLQLALSQYELQKSGLGFTNQTYKDVYSAYQQSQALASEVQQAETNVKERQFKIITALYDILINRLELERLNGFKINGR